MFAMPSKNGLFFQEKLAHTKIALIFIFDNKFSGQGVLRYRFLTNLLKRQFSQKCL